MDQRSASDCRGKVRGGDQHQSTEAAAVGTLARGQEQQAHEGHKPRRTDLRAWLMTVGTVSQSETKKHTAPAPNHTSTALDAWWRSSDALSSTPTKEQKNMRTARKGCKRPGARPSRARGTPEHTARRKHERAPEQNDRGPTKRNQTSGAARKQHQAQTTHPTHQQHAAQPAQASEQTPGETDLAGTPGGGRERTTPALHLWHSRRGRREKLDHLYFLPRFARFARFAQAKMAKCSLVQHPMSDPAPLLPKNISPKFARFAQIRV
jgi:hypothetical protein